MKQITLEDPPEPREGTAKRRVLDYLRNHRLNARGGWVANWEIARADVGGTEGLRRLRELRKDGWPIEREDTYYRLKP